MCVPLLTHTGDRKNPEMMFVMANINGKEQDDKQFNGEIEPVSSTFFVLL